MWVKKVWRKKTMADFKWSDNQKLAINETSSNVLISAGAGSGKTAVLTERIYQLVKKGADLSRFLVLTFTKAASEEMKSRIREKLLNDEEFKDLSGLVDASHIETFDAFALFLVKKYAFRIGVSPNIQIIDESLLKIQKEKILNERLTYLYQTNNSDIISLISKYCVKNDARIREFVIEISKHAELAFDKYGYLDSFIDNHFDERYLNQFIDEKYTLMIKAIDEAIDQAAELDDPKDAANIIDYLYSLKDKGTDFDSLLMFLNDFSFPRKPSNTISNPVFRDAIKDGLQKQLITEKEYGFRKEIVDQYMSTKKYIKTILDIVRYVEKELDSFKKEKNSYSFADVANMALRILDIPEIAKEMSEKFQYILVDEYQDTSLLQEVVLQKLGRNNVCMVGDVKQSIYRFRHADCTIFQSKFDKYQKGEDGKVIELNTSYRSRREIVDLVNDMFSLLMTPKSNPIDYKNGHNFEFGFTSYDEKIDPIEDYKLKVYRYPIVKGIPAYESESEIMAADIVTKINNKYKVYDTKLKDLRNCSFKDFAIIVDKGTNFDEIKEIFSKYEIPIKVIYDEPVKDSSIAYVLKNLLVLLKGAFDETYDDPKVVHAYMSIARSFLWKDKDSEIYLIVKSKAIKDSEIFKKINKFKEEIRFAPLSIILKRLVNEFDVYRKVIEITQFSKNTNKVELFINLASSMETLGFDIDDLIQYFEDLNEFDLDIPYVDSDVSEDSVTLITMHRSKGLEYPIVYLPLLTSNFSKSGSTSFIVSDAFGAVLPITGFTNRSLFFNHMHKLYESRANFEERLRLFYVAVTRARERLIMLYGVKENGDPAIINPASAKSFRDLVHYLNLENKYGVDFVISHPKITKEEKFETVSKIQMKTIGIEPQEIEVKKASKDRDENVNEALLEFGTEIHYLLEIADYETKDLSFISNTRMRRYINNVLSSKIFEKVKNNQLLHEFSFKDELNDTNGVIDCLIKKEDEIDIVDFKLKNLDDEKYILQLHTYRDYIKQISHLPIKMYLISAITGEVKEIE